MALIPAGTLISDMIYFDRGIKVLFACKHHPQYWYMSKQPSCSNWFPANEAARQLQWGAVDECTHTVKDDVWVTVEPYNDGQ